MDRALLAQDPVLLGYLGTFEISCTNYIHNMYNFYVLSWCVGT